MADAAVIAVSGALSAADTPILVTPVVEALDAGHEHVVLDLHDVRSADAGALSVIRAALSATAERGCILSAVGLRPGLVPRVEPLVVAGLRLHGTVRAAIATEKPRNASAGSTGRHRPARRWRGRNTTKSGAGAT